MDADQPLFLGCDLSHFQPKVEFHDIAKACKFAYVKLTQGGDFVDPNGADYIRRGLTVEGLSMGPYHFCDPRVPASENAQLYIARIDAVRRTLPAGADLLRAAVDVEAIAGWSSDAGLNAAWLSAFLNRIDAYTGALSLIYTPMGWFRDTFGNADFSGHPLWIASPGKEPDDLGLWKSWAYWQYGWKGAVPGAGTDSIDTDKARVLLPYN